MHFHRRLGLCAGFATVTLLLASCAGGADPAVNNAHTGQDDSAQTCGPPDREPGSSKPNGEELPADTQPISGTEAKFGETFRYGSEHEQVDITIQAPTESTGNAEYKVTDSERLCMVAVHMVLRTKGGFPTLSMNDGDFEAKSKNGSNIPAATVDNNINAEADMDEPLTGFVSFSVRDGDHLTAIEITGIGSGGVLTVTY